MFTLHSFPKRCNCASNTSKSFKRKKYSKYIFKGYLFRIISMMLTMYSSIVCRAFQVVDIDSINRAWPEIKHFILSWWVLPQWRFKKQLLLNKQYLCDSRWYTNKHPPFHIEVQDHLKDDLKCSRFNNW